MFIGYIVTFTVSLIQVLQDPYWIDNGVRERIYFPEHLVWASLGGGILQFVVVPIVFALFYLIDKIKHRTRQLI